MNLTYTCLAAPDHLISAGFSTVVAREDDRIPLAAFRVGADASKYCDEKNGLGQNRLTQTASVVKTPATGS